MDRVSVLGTWVTFYSGDIGDSLEPNALSAGRRVFRRATVSLSRVSAARAFTPKGKEARVESRAFGHDQAALAALIAHRNAAISRAIAATTTGGFLPVALRRR